jgi:hypothetical protein
MMLQTSGALLGRVAVVRRHEAGRAAVRAAEVRSAIGGADGPECGDRAVQHLDAAMEYGAIAVNQARGVKFRLAPPRSAPVSSAARMSRR